MATSTMTTGGGGGDRKSAFDCSICLEVITNPKVLPCGHSFCESCLSPLIKFGRLECPRCRQVADEPRNGFPTNFLLLQILERIEDECEYKANGRMKVSQSLLDINREQYERAREQLIATLQKFKSPEIKMVRERLHTIDELITSTKESITKFFKDLSDGTTAIEAMLANTFESLTMTDSVESFNRLPSYFDDERFERSFTSVQRKVSNLEQSLRRAADIDEESYDREEPTNRGNGISSNAVAPSNEPPRSATASSASSEHQETSGTREIWFQEKFVIDDKYSGMIIGKHQLGKHSIQNKYRCELKFTTRPEQPDSRLITIRGRDASLVKAAKTDIQSRIKESRPCFKCNVEGHIARACPQRSMVPKGLHGDSSDRSVRGRSSNIAGPSSSQSNGFGQISRSTSIGGEYGGGNGLPPRFGDNASTANIERGRLSLDDDK